MRPSLFDLKCRIYAAITILLFCYVEWVDSATEWGSVIQFLLRRD